MNILGKRIKRLREKNKIQQKELAKTIGVSSVVLSRYESGERKPDYDTLKMIADYFDVSTDYLLGHEANSDDEEKRRKAWIDKIKTEFADADLMFNDLANMSADDLEEVYDFIKFKLSQKGDW